ncbi:MAG TPA: hypothetical protein DHU56_16045 [Marinobacter sp.]|nr:hypothetical protein [Marinobacter sp.]
MTTDTNPSRIPLVRILFAFAAACLITSCGLSLSGGTPKLTERLPAEGGMIGPVEIDDPGSILAIRVYQPIPLGHWSSVTVSLLDAKKQFLLGLGDGFWHEEGRDYEGYYWRESETSYEGKLTVEDAGKYFLAVSAENNFDPSDLGSAQISVTVDDGGLSPIPHRAVGIIALILATAIGLIRYRNVFLKMIQEQ